MKFEVNIIKKEELPSRLQSITNSPNKLYAIGNVGLIYENSFAIVGTRNPTEYGIKICEKFSKELVMRDIVVVSGLAEGIDKIAHKTVIEYNGKTIGIIGCGFNCFMSEEANRKMFSNIINGNGLVLSEYDTNVEKNKINFPERNRIIAGISDGVLVVEAAYRSGSSITARFAKLYGKKVFAIPGKIDEKMSVGTNNLIKKGATLVTSPEEIINSFPQFANKMRKTIHSKKPKKKPKEYEEIIGFLKKESLTLEELQIKTNKNIRELVKILGDLEMEEIIKEDIGIGYSLIK